MNATSIGLVYAKEMRETLRDRRTLMVIILFPLAVYPLVSLILAQAVSRREARGEATPSRVGVAIAYPGGVDDAALLRTRLAQSPKEFVTTSHGGTPADVEADRLDALVEVLTPSPSAAGPAARKPPGALRLVYDETRDPSTRARERLERLFGSMYPGNCAPAFTVQAASIAPQAKVGGYILSKILPLVVVVMVMLGAFYPAVDITAGERERGTLETILSSPIDRMDLLAGKVLAVTTLATLTGVLNILSMSLTLVEGIHLFGGRQALGATIPWTRAGATLLMVIPSAFLFASVMIAVGAMARGFKEAQNLLTPVYFLCFTPSLIAGLGDYQLHGVAALIPAVNVTLLARDLVLGQAHLASAAVVIGATLFYGWLALTLAARLYDSERLLYADESRLSLGAWLGRLLLQRESPPPHARPGPALPPGAPNAAHAAAVFAVAFILLFFVFIPLQKRALVSGLLISEWAGMLGLVVVYARAVSLPLRDVLALRRPAPRALLGAALIGVSAWAVVGTISNWIAPAPTEVVEELRRVVAPADQSRGIFFTVLIMAVTPAICEEALFRGPILRGLAARFSPRAAAIMTGLLFGLYHVDVWRLLPTSALGVVLSLIALGSGSIVPAMVAHLLNNSCLIILAHQHWDDAATNLKGPAQAGLFVLAALVMILGAILVRGSGVGAGSGGAKHRL
ncbi:MAG TPA: ABC transporter permease subunit/CPBP intramembrane protease [Polyangia bacterium]|nr:ABC transporter permease subunit/CPBP intramembrane protease [Polyangia bacterium]